MFDGCHVSHITAIYLTFAEKKGAFIGYFVELLSPWHRSVPHKKCPLAGIFTQHKIY
ncbi:hypothetical protein ETAE_2091 [Edwardsiella piscicida]|uniref:Uncharacterized protein n=2 Tax=Edwardsiella TaxID=635 RepID=A0A0H3DRL1_EDWTF|nr:hypothetical protein ETAE_2091 [Edwardsiella tarda EIB202]ADM41996.1 hypothetical protein ETAF_1890 [Edwardsiella tarda FL6-60]